MLNLYSCCKYIIALSLITWLLSGCSSSSGRYQQANDSHPDRLPTKGELKNAVPKAENKSRGGNKKTYQVWGKSYNVLDHAEGFTETGTASWYGKKFHGHLTSNGEIYNMYGMSAAHKNLPLPTYVKVTNINNNKFVIVRVNDRGPFHQDRIIDLSYSAAYKLDMLKTGTASVKVTAITDIEAFNQANKSKPLSPVTPLTPLKPLTIQSSADSSDTFVSSGSSDSATTTPNRVAIPLSVAKKIAGKNHIQVFATTNPEIAKNTAMALSSLFQKKVKYPESQGIFRIQMGPISDASEIENILDRLKASGYPNAYRRSL
jgi:rare lipoprotein A